MKHYLIGKLDENLFEVIRFEEPVGGSRPRLMLKNKENSQKYLLKTYSHNEREIWAELCASKLGELLQIKIQKVSIKNIEGEIKKKFSATKLLPADWKPIGALVRHAFPSRFEIRYGKLIVGNESELLKLEEIESKIREKYYGAEPLLKKIAKMVIFDAFIGNMDRHHENWGVIEHESIKFGQKLLFPTFMQDRVDLATLFDHGSSLLFELDEDKVKRYLDNIDDFEKSYILGRKYTFFVNRKGEAENVFSLIRWYIDNDRGNWGKRFLRAIKEMFVETKIFDFEIAKTLLKMPVGYSEDRRKLLFESLQKRKKHLLSYL